MLTDLVVMDPVNSFQDGGERNLVCQCLWRDECSLGEGWGGGGITGFLHW